MILKLEENEIEGAKRLNDDLKEKGPNAFPLFASSTKESYDIRFRVTDIGKANIFLRKLFTDESLSEDVGIQITELRYPSLYNGKADLIKYLEKTIDDLKNI